MASSADCSSMSRTARACRRRNTSASPPPVVEYMLYFLLDLGLKVGHATRSIEDCLVEGAKDTTIRTALLDARYITGDKSLFADFHRRFRAACKEAGVAEY